MLPHVWWALDSPGRNSSNSCISTLTSLPGEVYRVGALAITTRNIVHPAVEQFKNLLEGLFVRPWDEYLFTLEVNERTLEVKKFAETEYKTASTTATAIALEDTPTDGATVRDDVAAKSTKKWQKLQDQVDLLTQAQRSQKNSRKGTSTSPQPTRQNKGGKDTNRSRKKPPTAQPAAAAANATSVASKRSSTKKKQKKKQPTSATQKK
jgi:hypothetical protein